MSDDIVSLFRGFSTVDKFTVEQFFPRRRFAAGETVCKYGDPGDGMYVVLTGHAEVRRPQRREGEFEVVARLEHGQVIGETSLVGDHKRNATVVALDDLGVLVVSREDMARLKAEKPMLAFALYEALIEQILVRFRSLTDKKDMLKFWLG